MKDINLEMGAIRAADMLRRGMDWRDVELAVEQDLRENVGNDVEADKFFRGNVEIGADQADLQSAEAAQQQGFDAPDPERVNPGRNRVESPEQRRNRVKREVLNQQRLVGVAGADRAVDDNRGGPAANEQRAIADELAAAERVNRVRADLQRRDARAQDGVRVVRAARAGEPGQFAARVAEQARKDRFAARPAGTPPAAAGNSEKQLFDQIQNKLAAGELTGDAAVQAQGLLRRMAERVNPQFAKQQEAKQGRAAVQAANQNFNSSLAAANNAAAANPVGRFIEAGNNERIGEVVIAQQPGGNKDFIGVAPIIRPQDDPANFGQASWQNGMWVGSGNPLQEQGPQMPASLTNAPGGTGMANAPVGGASLMDVMEREQFAARKSGTFPQVDIGGELGILQERLNNLGVATPNGIRNLAEAQALFDEGIGLGMEAGAKFNEFGGKRIVDNPGADELFAKMRFNQPEVQRVANALIQLELGNRSPVNQSQKEAFNAGLAAQPYELARPIVDPSGPLLEGHERLSIAQQNAEMVQNVKPEFGAREAMGDFNAGPEMQGLNARAQPRMAALKGERIEGTPQERAEALADAQRNVQGLVRGEDPVGILGKRDNPNMRFNAAGTNDPDGIRSFQMQQAANRAKKAGKPADMGRVEQNVLNAQAVAKRGQEFDAAGPPKRREERVSNFMAKQQAVADHAGRTKPAFAGRPQKGEGASISEKFGLDINQAANAQPPAPVNEDQRGPRRIGDDIKNTLAELNSGAYQGNPTRPLTDELRGELAALGGRNAPQQGPVMANRKKSISEIMQRETNRAKSLMTSPRFKRGRRVVAGGAAAAGLASLIGGERDRREEEQY